MFYYKMVNFCKKSLLIVILLIVGFIAFYDVQQIYAYQTHYPLKMNTQTPDFAADKKPFSAGEQPYLKMVSRISSDKPDLSNYIKDGIINRYFFGADVMHFDVYLKRVYPGKDLHSLLLRHIHLLKDLGIGIVGINLNWREIESDPPRGDAHLYNWEKLDAIMKLLHDSELRVKLQIFPGAPWAAIVPAKPLNRAGPLKERCLKDWRAFVQKLVARYDGDGKDDAFPMNFPLLQVLQVAGEVEALNNWRKYGGSPENYDKLLTTTTQSVRCVSRYPLVARGAVNFGPAFDRIKNKHEFSQKLKLAKAQNNPRMAVLRFFLDSLKEEDIYNLLGIQFNYHWSGIVPQVEWIREKLQEVGYSKPICGNHTRTTLIDPKLETILLSQKNPNYKSAKAIYFRNQAIHTIKKLTVGLDAGLRYMLVATIFDGAFTGTPGIQKYKDTRGVSWFFTGLFDGEVSAGFKDISQGPKPVYFSYKLFISKVLGCSREVEIIHLGANVNAFRFNKEGKSIYILWHEDKKTKFGNSVNLSRKVSLPISSDKALITHIITEINQKSPKIETIKAKDGKIELLVSDVPIFIEEL